MFAGADGPRVPPRRIAPRPSQPLMRTIFSSRGMKTAGIALFTLLAGIVLLAGATLLSGAPRASAVDPFLRRTAAVLAVERVGPAVVNITTEQVVAAPTNPFGPLLESNPLFDQFFKDFFEPRAGSRSVQSLGSGVLIDDARRVLTNAHVIARASRIRVSLADGREYDASVVGADPNNDIAVLQVEADEKLPWVDPGSSGDLMVGEPVIAIGNPFGLSNTVTTGVISALDRSVRTEHGAFHGFLQTDASINPGNSGGPLLNAEGNLIGINSAIYGGAEGIGFAIPIDAAMRVVHELIVHGEVAPVWLGLELQDLDTSLREALTLPEGVQGPLVNGVRPESPASRAGIRRGDVVTRFERFPVRSVREFYDALDRVTNGQQVRIEVWRDDRSVPLETRAEALPEGLVEEIAERLLGLRMTSDGSGFRVESVREGSNAARIGLQPGDLVLRLNGLVLNDDGSLRSAVLNLRGRDRALLVVQRGAGRYHVTLPIS